MIEEKLPAGFYKDLEWLKMEKDSDILNAHKRMDMLEDSIADLRVTIQRLLESICG